MKRICFVTTLSGTIKSFLLDLARYLVAEDGYDVTFICSDDDSMLQFTGERIHYIPVKMKRGLSLDGFSAIWKLYKFFRRERFDIVQYSTKNAGTYASVASFLAGIKCRLYCQWGMMFVALKGWKRLLLKWDEKLICGLSTVIEVESFSIYNEAVKHHIYKPEKASVIWNGSACGVKLDAYDLSRKEEWRREVREKFGIPADAPVFGYCGRITRDKGLNELFEAFRQVAGESGAYLMIIGSYDNPKSIRQDLLEWAQQSSQVVFTGFTKEVPKHYSALDVFASLSYREGFGLVVIEAAAMEIPGIVTNVPGQRDTVIDGKTGILVPGHDVEHVVDVMKYYIGHREEARKMGKAARLRVETEFEQKELFRQLAEHRNNLIDKKA